MSKFKRLSIDEAKEQFPLLNEEASKALKGGCSMCDELRRQYPNMRIYTEDEYDRMCADGTWTVGPVCGIGVNVLGTANVTPESQCDIHMWPFPDKECEYCYFDRFAYCLEHEQYFNDLHGCSYCYWEEFYEKQYDNDQYYDNFEDYSYTNRYDSESYDQDRTDDYGYSGSVGGDGSDSGSSSSGDTEQASVYNIKEVSDMMITQIIDKYGSELGEQGIKTLSSELKNVVGNNVGRFLVNTITEKRLWTKFEIGETSWVKYPDGEYGWSPAAYDSNDNKIIFLNSDKIDISTLSEELAHAVQRGVYGSTMSAKSLYYEFEAKIIRDMLMGGYILGDSVGDYYKYEEFSSTIKNGGIDESAMLEQFHDLYSTWKHPGYEGSIKVDKNHEPKLLKMILAITMDNGFYAKSDLK